MRFAHGDKSVQIEVCCWAEGHHPLLRSQGWLSHNRAIWDALLHGHALCDSHEEYTCGSKYLSSHAGVQVLQER